MEFLSKLETDFSLAEFTRLFCKCKKKVWKMEDNYSVWCKSGEKIGERGREIVLGKKPS